jgi:hypothetical protein
MTTLLLPNCWCLFLGHDFAGSIYWLVMHRWRRKESKLNWKCIRVFCIMTSEMVNKLFVSHWWGTANMSIYKADPIDDYVRGLKSSHISLYKRLIFRISASNVRPKLITFITYFVWWRNLRFSPDTIDFWNQLMHENKAECPIYSPYNIDFQNQLTALEYFS